MSNIDLKMGFLMMVGEFISTNVQRGRPALKNAVRTLMFRPTWYRDDHQELERVFRTLRDPWNFESSAYEKERLRILLQEVLKYPHESILEVGCAEGIFTSMLPAFARRVVAIDVSPTAIDRARQRCPLPTYVTTSLDAFQADDTFDLVICAETLYYIKDVQKAIEKLSSLGRYCMVSYLDREAKRLDAYMKSLPLVHFTRCEIGQDLFGRAIILAVWENAPTGSRALPGQCAASSKPSADNSDRASLQSGTNVTSSP